MTRDIMENEVTDGEIYHRLHRLSIAIGVTGLFFSIILSLRYSFLFIFGCSSFVVFFCISCIFDAIHYDKKIIWEQSQGEDSTKSEKGKEWNIALAILSSLVSIPIVYYLFLPFLFNW